MQIGAARCSHTIAQEGTVILFVVVAVLLSASPIMMTPSIYLGLPICVMNNTLTGN